MNQFGKIFSFEFKSYLKNKIFVGVTIFLVAVIAVVMFFPRVISAIEADDDADVSTDVTADSSSIMLVKAESQEQSDAISAAFAAAFAGDYTVESTSEELESIKDKITSGEIECAFVITGETSYTYYVKNLSLYDINTSVADEVLQEFYRMNIMLGSGMSAEDAAAVMSVQIESSVENLGTDQTVSFWYAYVMIFALYMVILLYGQMVATNVATEKSSRAMELLVTSAKPVSMMFGKVLASCLAGLIQLVAIFGSAILCYSLNDYYWGDNYFISSIFDMPPSLFGYMLVFFVLGFLFYAFMYGAVGSTASKLEDINTSVMPITMLFIAGFFVVIFSLTLGDVDNTLMMVCSYIPFTSPMAMFTRIAMSVVPWYEIAISICILIVSVVGIGIISAKIYRVGVLLYGTKPKIGSIIKAVWKA